jgi:hypothetical protein
MPRAGSILSIFDKKTGLTSGANGFMLCADYANNRSIGIEMIMSICKRIDGGEKPGVR